MSVLINTLQFVFKSFGCLILICFFSTKLFGQLSFHNTATEDVFIALHYIDQGVWRTQGWYKVAPLQSETIVPKITNRYYYYSAFSSSRKLIWSGRDVSAWVHKTKAFKTIQGKNYSAEQGYEKIGFKQIDVGNKTSFTYTLDFRTNFVKELEEYFQKGNLDSIEGMYSISDDITIETNAGAVGILTANEQKNHWAKVAIVKDTVSVSRNYVEFVIEGEGLREGTVRTEFLKTAQSPTLFVCEQRIKSKEERQSTVVELHPDTGIIENKFEYSSPRKKHIVKRSYLKYFPK